MDSEDTIMPNLGGANTSAFTCYVRKQRPEYSTQVHLCTPPSSPLRVQEINQGSLKGLTQWDWKGGGIIYKTYIKPPQHSDHIWPNFSKNLSFEDISNRREENNTNKLDLRNNNYLPNVQSVANMELWNSSCNPTKSAKKLDKDYISRSKQLRHSVSYRNSSSSVTYLTFLLAAIMVFQSFTIAFSQITDVSETACSPTTDCHPVSTNLLNSNYLKRTVETSTTCGTPEGTTTVYRKSATTSDFQDYYCNATDLHPKEYMYDHQNEQVLDYQFENPKLNTYWQSKNTVAFIGDSPSQEYVIFNMTEGFLIRYIRVIFISPHIDSQTSDSDMRPRALVLERQATPGAEWEPWRYYSDRCLFYFSSVPYQPMDGSGPDYDALTPVCQNRYYAGSVPLTGWGYGRQEVIFNPSSDYNREFQTSDRVQRHYLASAIRLSLVQPSGTEPLSSYYAIGDLEVDGQCACFGHASVCTGDNSAICVCHHNTEGDNCERCLPLYNNKPWRAGYLQQSHACEDCGCRDHAVSCHYAEDKGYGICDNCTEHTTGDKCQFCDDHFYINPENITLISPTEQCTGFNGTDYITYHCNKYCIPCNCSLDGSDALGGFTCQNDTGDCLCKTHVTGRDCSVCKDEFWNLTASNPNGCITCDCELSGTYNNTHLCDKEEGHCICKANTQGYRCSECKPGYYGLSLFDMDGCESCGCDPGGSLNTTCPVNTGICPCRENLEGRSCMNPLEEFYVPALDHLTFEAEFIPNITAEYSVLERPGHGQNDSTVSGRGFVALHESASLTFIVSVPLTFSYHVVLRYETAAIWINSHISMRAKVGERGGEATDYTCGTTTVNTGDLQQLEMTLEPASLRGGADFGTLCLKAGMEYELRVELGNADPRNEELHLDSVVMLPSLLDMPFFASVSPEMRQLMQDCYRATVPLDLAQRANFSCAQPEYSVMAYIYQGAIGCQCDMTGSNSSMCEPMGGQCPCKPGVSLLDCRQCEVDHYGFSSGQGCTPCNCDPHGSVRTACNDTGICECKENVEGIKCDQCLPEYFGRYTGGGCEKCNCNMDYSYNNSCLDSGQCHCKPGVGGLNCDNCLDGFYQLTSEGCTACGCDDGGSTSHLCDKVSGVCTCKTLAIGDKCDQCSAGYFALGDWSPSGCLQCYCSGHSTTCQSASGWFLTNASNDWSLLNSATAIEGPWLGVDDQGDAVTVQHPTKIIGNDGQFVMQIVNNEENMARDNLFFLAMESYVGNKRSAYMHHFTFTLSMYVPPPADPNVTVDNILVDRTSGDVIMESEHLTFKLVVALPDVPAINTTEYSYQMNTEAWHVDTTDGPNPTYVQMIQMLAELSAIKIRAKYSNVTGAEVALYSALLTYAVKDDTSGISVNNVENCTCPKPYIGEECEQCAPGYTRLTPGGGPYIDCVPCNCHGHEAPDVPCDPETGECTCLHNTEGRTCELCMPGYNGDPTRGNPDACSACTCPGDVIAGAINVFASTCELGPQGTPMCHNCSKGHGGDMCDVCIEHWYGTPTDPANNQGSCVPCECNGRADTCNTTSGFCIDCRNNTAGKECDICSQTFFGNAMTNSCEKCDCGLPGATGDCDHRTGQCECKPNVVGFSCSECGPNSYNYSSGEGCHDCDCHPIGSMDTQCDVVSGQCVCNTHLIGRRCDVCEDTYWNINARTGCDPCQCTEAGSLNTTGEAFGICDLITGQCHCNKDAIIGRTCDYCAKGTKAEYIYVQGIYVGAYPNCELCGECFDNWAVKIDTVGEAANDSYIEALHIWNHYGNMTTEQLLPIMGNLSANLSLVEDSINTTQILVTSLMDIQLRYENLLSNVTELMDDIKYLEDILDVTEGNLMKLQTFDGTVTVGASSTTTITQISHLVIEVGELHTDLYIRANASWDNIQNMTEAVRLSNGSVQVFVQRVAQAMSQLEDAQAMAEAADLVLAGKFFSEDVNNSIALQQQEALMQNFPDLISNAAQVVEDSYIKVTEANVTIDSARNAVDAKLTQMFNSFREAQTTMVNATRAKIAADDLKLVVDLLLNEASNTRGNLTVALLEVVQGLEVMTNLTQEAFYLDQQALSIDITFLRSLAELQAVTDRIESTAVSSEEVQQLMERSERTLQTAHAAINVTATATDSAYQTEELVRQIQHHLEVASIERATTTEHLTTMSLFNKTITETTIQVQMKAGLAMQLAGEVARNVSSAALEITETYKCFQDKQIRANDTKTAAVAAQTKITLVASDHVKNIRNLQNVSGQTEALEGKFTTNLAGLKEIKVDVDDLLDELGLVSGSSDVDVLLADFEVQKAEMDKLQNELKIMEGDIDQTMSRLDSLDPETAQCSHS